MNVHHDKKTVDIWITRSEARNDNFRKSLEPYYQQFKEKKYFVSVFESGERDLFSDTVLLLRHNLELQIKAELAAEQTQAERCWMLSLPDNPKESGSAPCRSDT